MGLLAGRQARRGFKQNASWGFLLAPNKSKSSLVANNFCVFKSLIGMQNGGLPPPPGSWSSDVRPSPQGDAAARADVEQVATAWKHCKSVARDEGRTPDLFDLLSHSVREAQYSFPPQGVSTIGPLRDRALQNTRVQPIHQLKMRPRRSHSVCALLATLAHRRRRRRPSLPRPPAPRCSGHPSCAPSPRWWPKCQPW